MIFCSNPYEQFKSKKQQILKAIQKVCNSNNYILGKEVINFEKKFSKYIGSKFCIGVANGTDAIELTLLAIGIKPGDEVITVSHTALATVSGIISAGATPVLLDIRSDDYNIDTKNIEKNINKNTKAIIAVHLYGHSSDILVIKKICRKYKIKLIEDVSQAHGGKFNKKLLGSFGDFSTFSFYPTKNLGAIGDGGAICLNNVKFYQKLKSIREYGWNKNRKAYYFGKNSRLDEIQASILLEKLKYLDLDVKKRNIVARIYFKLLKNNKFIILPSIRDNVYHAFHLFVIKVKNRKKLLSYLNKNNIFPGIHYSIPIHQQPAYKKYIKCYKKLKITEAVSKSVISLPMYPELERKKIFNVARLINEFYKKKK